MTNERKRMYDIRGAKARFHLYQEGARVRFSSSPPLWGGFRWGLLSSSTAQFMQADNYIQSPKEYIDYNRYAYCRYNPFKYTDPSGEQLMYNYGNDHGPSGAGYAAEMELWQQQQTQMAFALFDEYCDDARISYYKSKNGFAGRVVTSTGTVYLKEREKPTSDTGTGGVSQGVVQTEDGVYLVGSTSEEKAKLAEAINKKIDGVINYDEATGKILSWSANSPENSPSNLDLLEQSRGDLDAILSFTNSENKRIEIQFGDSKQNISGFQIDDGVGQVYMARMFETNTNGNWWHRLNGRENMTSSMNHELNHAKNLLYFGTAFYQNDLGRMFKETEAIISTNYLNMYYGWNIRSSYYYPNDISLPARQRR